MIRNSSSSLWASHIRSHAPYMSLRTALLSAFVCLCGLRLHRKGRTTSIEGAIRKYIILLLIQRQCNRNFKDLDLNTGEVGKL